MIELERTFLIKYLPEDLKKFPHVECIDIYLPLKSRHPHLRIRKLGDKYEITSKSPVKNDPSHQIEQTINLSHDEFKDLSKVKGKRVHKIRYYYPIGKYKAEIDVFQKDLKGLILADFEFKTLKQKKLFIPPDFCLADVTKEEFIAGGCLAGKKIEDITSFLKKYNYFKVSG